MEISKLKSFLKQRNQPNYRFQQIFQAIFKQGIGEWSKVTTIPQPLREELEKEIPLFSFTAEKVLVSRDKRAFKALLRLGDGLTIETVLLNSKPGLWSCCLSTQVGCAFGCRFCATGMMGFKRNLTVEEITDT